MPFSTGIAIRLTTAPWREDGGLCSEFYIELKAKNQVLGRCDQQKCIHDTRDTLSITLFRQIVVTNCWETCELRA